MKASLTLLLFIFSLNFVIAQNNDEWMLYDGETPVVQNKDTALNFDAPDGTIKVEADPRVQALIDFVGRPKAPDPVLMKGYRVQIAFSQKKAEAQQSKMAFLNQHDEYKTYTDYLAPNFRIRVGNFKTRLEAEKLQNEIMIQFPGAIVVNDLIELPNLEGCDYRAPEIDPEDQ